MLGNPLLFGLLYTWITPLWLLSVGVALGVAILAIGYGILFLVSRQAADVAVTSVREGILLPIFYLAMFLTLFAAAGIFLVPDMPYASLIAAVSRIGAVGQADIEVTLPPESHDVPLDALRLRLVELQSFSAEADQPVTLVTNIRTKIGQNFGMRLAPGAIGHWERPAITEKDPTLPNLLTEWTASNTGSAPAKLQVHTVTDIQFPEVRVVPAAALALIGLVLVYIALRQLMPKISAIALTTAKEAMYQPLFYVVVAWGCFALVAFIFIPYNTFGEDVKMLESSGLTLIMVLSIIVAVWSASVSVSEEVEGRTALTVLSKPVRRRQFILGKFLGVLGPVVVLFVMLGLLLLVTVSFKVVYDSREVAKSEPPWQSCYVEMMRMIPGMVLSFFETVVLAAISVAISTRLSMLANLIVCASIYAVGHLVPMVVHSSVGRFEIVRFVGQFIATVLPVLDNFNIQTALAAGKTVPLSYLGLAAVYCVLYTTAAMILGLLMFEDRDLA